MTCTFLTGTLGVSVMTLGVSGNAVGELKRVGVSMVFPSRGIVVFDSGILKTTFDGVDNPHSTADIHSATLIGSVTDLFCILDVVSKALLTVRFCGPSLKFTLSLAALIEGTIAVNFDDRDDEEAVVGESKLNTGVAGYEGGSRDSLPAGWFVRCVIRILPRTTYLQRTYWRNDHLR